MVALTVKTSGWGINSYRIWKPCDAVQTISLSTSGQLRSKVILLMGDKTDFVKQVASKSSSIIENPIKISLGQWFFISGYAWSFYS